MLAGSSKYSTASSCSRRLIVTADDFGVSPAVNEAVVRAHRDGILQYASLMVAEPHAGEAVHRAKRECPGLSVGLHAVLCAGQSIAESPDLTDSKGRFPDDPVLCGMRYFFDRALYGALELELRAQFERFLASGLPPTHVDGHVNIHAHPVLFPMMVRLAREYRFERIRLPGGEFALSMRYSIRPFWKQFVEATVFSLLRRYLLRAFGDPMVRVPDRVFGVLRSGLMNEDYLEHCLRSLPYGLTEIYFHPSAEPGTEAVDRPQPTHRTISELRTLLSERVRDALGNRIELVGGGA